MESNQQGCLFQEPDIQGGIDTTDRIIGSLEGVSGHTFDIEYDLFFTTERVIAVIVRRPDDVSPSYSLSLVNLFIGSWRQKRTEQAEQDRLVRERRQKLKGKTPDELLSHDPLNREVRYDSIRSVEVTRRFFDWYLRFLLLQPRGEKIVQFRLRKEQLPEVRVLLEKVLHSKYKAG